MVSPSASSSGGNTSNPNAAISSGTGTRFVISGASFETHDALAEQTARPEQQHQKHQEIDRGGGGRRITDADHHALDEADQQRRDYHAPERPKPANHHDDERRRDDFLPHRRM